MNDNFKNTIVKTIRFLLLLVTITSCRDIPKENVTMTMCNPINLDYRFVLDNNSPRRDAANPCITLYCDEYYLFMSNGGGYYRSKDMLHWNLVPTNLPMEENAPTVININNELYFTASGTKTIYKTSQPESGIWEIVCDNLPYQVAEPMLFYDSGKLYLYSGSGNSVPLTGMEIDPSTFLPLGSSIDLINSNKEKKAGK